MQIISCDNYFILGIQSLIVKLNIGDTSGRVIFDSGNGGVYILNLEKLRRLKISDPLSALVLCGHSLLSRNATLDMFDKKLRSKNFKDITVIPLTRRERLVIKDLCNVSNQKNLARRLDISDKTVSAHKKNGLRKLGVKNTMMLHSTLKAWREILQTINPNTQP